MNTVTESRYTVLRWDAEGGDFNWWLGDAEQYDWALESAQGSAKGSHLSNDLIGIRDNLDKSIVTVILKYSPEDLPISLVQVYELKEVDVA